MLKHALVERFAIVIALTGLAALSRSASADITVYSQPPLFGNGDSFPAELNGGQQADNWVANTNSTVGLFRWWGTQVAGGGANGSFTLRIFSDSGGLPGSLLNSFTIGNAYTQATTGQSDFNGRDIYKYEALLPGGGFTPNLGATYWVNIMNNQSVVGPPGFLWHQGSGPDNNHAFRVGAGSWSSIGGDMAFELVVIPTPGALGLFALSAARPRRRRN
jgi:hypothetical protein